MVLTDRQRADLHAGIHDYLLSQEGEAFARAAAALAEADPDACKKTTSPSGTPLLEKKWTAIPRLQKKVLELERAAAQNAKIHAHRAGGNAAGGPGAPTRRMLPRLPANHTLQGHSAAVSTVAVHPVYTIVASGSEDGTIKVWDHESGDYIRTLKGHTNTVTSLAFSPTGSHLASASTDISIKLWDFTTYACVRTLRGHDHTISSVGFLPSGSNLTLSVSSTLGGDTSAISLDAETAGSQLLLSASRDKTVKVWDIETGFCDQTISDHGDWVRCLAIRPYDGGLFCSAGNDTVINVYDGENRQKVCELRGHEHVVESVAFVCESSTPNSHNNISKTVETARNYIASGGRDRSVRLWNITSVTCIAVFAAHENWVRSVLIHPSGNYLISGGDDRTIRVMDIAANRCLRTLESAHPHFVTSLSIHHTLPVLVSGGVDSTVKCWMLD